MCITPYTGLQDLHAEPLMESPSGLVRSVVKASAVCLGLISGLFG